ncbi:28767_t:CDS:1, partial [Dentiscutata erythropus]
MSFTKQAIVLQGENNSDNELDDFLKDYIEKKNLEREKETQERERRILKERHNTEEVLAIQVGNDQLVSVENILDLAYHVGKGTKQET